MISEQQYNKLYNQYLDLLKTNDELLKAYNKSSTSKALKGCNDEGYYKVELEKIKEKQRQYNINIIIKAISIILILIIYVIAIIFIKAI